MIGSSRKILKYKTKNFVLRFETKLRRILLRLSVGSTWPRSSLKEIP